ncbi:MAG: phenylalanine--tRNA ligase subunit alpha, partial [Deltaproteobacteria bacterium]|nr:phenylalanine--tRNA ligase subunit alpha [Deltaproteobacteria bacterium]
MKTRLEEIRRAAMARLSERATAGEIEEVRVRTLGRSGELTLLMRQLGGLAPEERRDAGRLLNEIKQQIEARLAELKIRLQQEALRRAVAEPPIDPTLPGLGIRRGRFHPLTVVLEQALDIFESMGFEVAETQDIEDDFHNFSALNFPPDHPAREMQDTFFLGGGLLLRTHTSNGQVRVMESRQPPLAVVCPGNCYRRDELSVRASPMFGQIEGFMVDRVGAVTLADLKGVLGEFLRAFFGPRTNLRFRASFFPFTEPSV